MSNDFPASLLFLRSLLIDPRKMGALVPSSPQLSRLIASRVDPSQSSVLEIGAGRGIITGELARIAKRVIAIEKDPDLVRLLRKRFDGRANVEIAACDFSRFPLPADGEYQVRVVLPGFETPASETVTLVPNAILVVNFRLKLTISGSIDELTR